MVLMSAVTPAPDEGSKPAMVSTTLGVSGIVGQCTANRAPQAVDEVPIDRFNISSGSVPFCKQLIWEDLLLDWR